MGHCTACRRGDDFCAGERVPRYCELMAADPDGWEGAVARAGAAVAAWPDPPPITFDGAALRAGGVVADAAAATAAGAAPRQGAPYATADHFLAPLRRRPDGRAVDPAGTPRFWEGCSLRKPWEYRTTAIIVHLDTPELLAAAVATLRAQTERPYLMVMDTGSLAEHRGKLEALELAADDLEVHYLRPRGWRCTSQPIAAAMDAAFALCQTEVAFATHTDVFLRRSDFLAEIVALCSAANPVVGYRMSPRPLWPDDLWREVPSHTATVYHLPTVRKLGLRWDMVEAFGRLGLPVGQPYYSGFPDTEVNLGLGLKAAGIAPIERAEWEAAGRPAGRWICLGDESNEPYEDRNLVHERSYTVRQLFGGADGARRARTGAAVAAAHDRSECWEAQRAGRGNAVHVGRDIWVGNFTACDARAPEFDRRVHVWHGTPGAGVCQRTHTPGPADLAVVYHDRDPLATLSVAPEALASFLGACGRVLLHCGAGMCRGPTIAVLGLVARGEEPPAAIAAVRRAVLAYAPEVYLPESVMAEIAALAPALRRAAKPRLELGAKAPP